MINFSNVEELEGITFSYGKRLIKIHVLPSDNCSHQPMAVFDKDNNAVKIYKQLPDDDITGYEHALVHELAHVCTAFYLSQPEPILVPLEVIAESVADFLPGMVDEINSQLNNKYEFEFIEDEDFLAEDPSDETKEDSEEGEECV